MKKKIDRSWIESVLAVLMIVVVVVALIWWDKKDYWPFKRTATFVETHVINSGENKKKFDENQAQKDKENKKEKQTEKFSQKKQDTDDAKSTQAKQQEQQNDKSNKPDNSRKQQKLIDKSKEQQSSKEAETIKNSQEKKKADKTEIILNEFGKKYENKDDELGKKESEIKSVKSEISNADGSDRKKNKISNNIKDEITLSEERYFRIYEAKKEESKKQTDSKKYPWAIDNNSGKGIAESYRLFQMELVAVVGEKKYNFKTGELLMLGQKDIYSTTTIQCERPLNDFPELYTYFCSKNGVSDPKIYYYMSQSTSNYFLNKVNSAASCLIERQLIAEGPGLNQKVMIVGQVYKIMKSNGGQIGVFLPTTALYINPETGKESEILIAIDCFDNHQDIQEIKDLL